MPRIDRLTIQGFRSFGPNAKTLSFDAPLAAIWGANSEGKTSLAEAIEFLFTGDIARRALLASAVDEFEGSLRNAHLPEDTKTYVEATVTGLNGESFALRRTLLEDFTKRSTCQSKLELDGIEISSSDLPRIGIQLSEPPLAAPVLMQHTLGYLFSANPKQRSSYFKSVLEVADLDQLRDALRSLANNVPMHSRIHQDRVDACIAAMPGLGDSLAPLSTGAVSIVRIEAAVSAVAERLISEAGEEPSASLAQRLAQLEGMTAAKQAETFPLHGFNSRRQPAGWTPPADPTWSTIESYRTKLDNVDREAHRMTALFQEVLKLPVVDASTGDIECPVCESPASLTQVRIQTIRDHLKNSEDIRNAERNAKVELGVLSTSVRDLESAVLARCPDFLCWGSARRNSEGFRTDRLAPLLGENSRDLLPPWFESVVRLMRVRRGVRMLAAQAHAALIGPKADATELEEISSLRAAFAPLQAAYQSLLAAVDANKAAADRLLKPLQEAVTEHSDTTGWEELILLGRSATALEAEVLETTARDQLSIELEQACKQVEAAKESVLQDKFDALAGDVRDWWELLRPGEAAFFSDLGLRKKAQRTIDFKAGLSPSTDRNNATIRNAVAVFSQSQMHCLGLATFLARRGTGSGFLVLDDPFLAIDDDYSVHLITAVLTELQRRGVQVIVLTHSQNTWRAIQSRYPDGRSEAFQLNLDDPSEGTTIVKSNDALTAMLKACGPFTMSSALEIRKDGCQKIRDAAERLCKELLVQEQRRQGNSIAMVSDYTGPNGTLGVLVPFVTPLLASDEPGKLNLLRDMTNPGNHDDDVPAKETLKVCLGDLKALRRKHLVSIA